MDFFYKIFEDLPRQGPGDTASTKKAFEQIQNLPNNPKILDIGCGTGTQTLDLAQLTTGYITAVDNYQPFLDKLTQKAISQNLQAQIKTGNQDMNELDFQPEKFNLIWSEGSIFIIGFENGLRNWKKFLKTDGYLVISEIAYLRKDIPDQLIKAWQEFEIDVLDIDDHLQLIEQCGYELIDHFTLPESGWWESYYIPMESRLSQLRAENQKNEQNIQIIEEHHKEIELYRKYSRYYGYVFYIMQKNS